MRHLHFVQSTEPLEGGGLGRAALDLHRAMQTAGETSRAITTGRTAAGGPSDDVQVFARTAPHKLYYAPAMRRAVPALVADADVVHGHGFYTATNGIVGGAARRQGKTLVLHPHGMFEPWILGRSRGKKALVHFLWETANFRHAKLWRALTKKEADQIRAQGIAAPIVVAANGIHLADFAPPAAPAPAKPRRRILFLGRLHPKKGVDLLLLAWAQLRAFHGEWELVLAGPDELGHRAELEAIVARENLGGSVSFPGTVTGATKLALLHGSDLFALTSHSEGFSVAILESLACRVPVLATNACNFPELGETGAGWLCEPDVASVRAVLERALTAPELERLQRGEAARRLVEQSYTWAAITRTVLDAIRSVQS